jgi:quercetin dioxygenase-like cupin family protein/DNA-binding XRE family transcriptional regulator
MTTYSPPQLGRALAELRRRQGYSLHEVAGATGISRSFLSLVENGRSDITMGRLLRLVTFYGAQIADVLPLQQPQDPVVVRRGEEREVRSPAEGMRIGLLAPETEHKMTPSIAVVEPTGASAEYSSHPGEEFIHVLEGSLTLEFEGADPIRLDEGDSAYFDSERPHGYRNNNERPVRFLTISTPPTF